MFITLCYVYLWVRFHKCYSVLIRSRLSKLNGGSSLSFSLCPGSASLLASPTGGHRAARPQPDLSPVENVFLQIGDKSVNITKLQVGGSTKLSLSYIHSTPLNNMSHSRQTSKLSELNNSPGVETVISLYAVISTLFCIIAMILVQRPLKFLSLIFFIHRSDSVDLNFVQTTVTNLQSSGNGAFI